MKKKMLYTAIVCLTMACFPLSSSAAVAEEMPSAISSVNADAPPEVKTLLLRLDEIRTMDKTHLSRAEKKKLRKEVKEIHSSLKAVGCGIYISGGTLILIIILLIIFL